MSAYLLLWNPKRWKWREEDFAKAVRDTASGNMYKDRWSCGVTKRIAVGSRAFLMRVGNNQPGILAAGFVTSKPHDHPHFDPRRAAAGEEYLCVDCEWQRILDADSMLPLSALKRDVSDHFIWTPRASGVTIPPKIAEKLEEIWAEYTGSFSQSMLAAADEPQFLEGEKKWVQVLHRYRERKLRDKKIEAVLKSNGGRLKCEVPNCGFDFYEVYGKLGANYAHVHHKKPIGKLEAPSNTSLTDLAIVCANCHAMIHRNGECRDMKDLISK